jgi:hypothetical protein
MASARGISFDFRPSGTLIRLAATIVALATVAPLFTDLSWPVRWFLAAVLGLYGCRRLAAFRRPPVTSVAWAADGVWTVTLPGGVDKPASLAGSRVFGTAVFLNLRWSGGAGHLAMLPDNTPSDTLRLLRARLATQTPA